MFGFTSDFGIAKIVEQNSLISLPTALGTPAYMAPEQSQGKVCAASDQYALAVILYEWITGERPFKGTALAVIAQHRLDTPPSLRAQVSDLPITVEQVILKALSKKPEERFISIREFLAALKMSMQVITAHPQTGKVVAPTSIDALNAASLVHKGLTTLPISDSFPISEKTASMHVLPKSRTALPPLAPQNQPLKHKHRQLPGRGLLLGVLAFLLVVSGAGIFLTTYGQHLQLSWQNIPNTPRHDVLSNATTTAQSKATTTAQPTATMQALNRTILDPYQNLGILAFADSLSQPNRWSTHSNVALAGTCQFSQGALEVTQSSAGVKEEYSCNTSDIYRNFAFQVQMAIVQGYCGGIEVRASSSSLVSYEFRLCRQDDGVESYGFYKFPMHDDNDILIEGGFPENGIHPDLRQQNIIAVVAENNRFIIYINGQKLDSATDGAYSQGTIGLMALDASVPTVVKYRNAKLWTYP